MRVLCDSFFCLKKLFFNGMSGKKLHNCELALFRCCFVGFWGRYNNNFQLNLSTKRKLHLHLHNIFHLSFDSHWTQRNKKRTKAISNHKNFYLKKKKLSTTTTSHEAEINFAFMQMHTKIVMQYIFHSFFFSVFKSFI